MKPSKGLITDLKIYRYSIHKCLVIIKNEKSTLNSIEKRTKKDYNKRDTGLL